MIGRRVATFDDLEWAGDYYLTSIDDRGIIYLWFLLPIHEGADKFDYTAPGSGLHSITSPPWTFRECEDGSVEVRASIACGRGTPDGEYWHGFLDEGHIWRSC